MVIDCDSFLVIITGWFDLLALVCGVYCEFVTFPIGILGQVWYLIVSIPDLCTLTYYDYDSFLGY